MVRIPLILAALYFSILAAFSQTTAPQDSSAYKSRKLKVEEINFVSSYYHQEGDNAAVTGGIGSERLTDVATTLDLRMSRRDSRNRLHNYTAEVGIDFYTSASSDKVDPSTISSASSNDVRFYPSFAWTVTNEEKKQIVGASASVSAEYDYLSTGGGVMFSKDSRDNNRQFLARVQSFFDFVTLIYPIELRNGRSTGQKPRNTFSGSFTLSQIINRRLQVALVADVALQKGYLSLPFNRVYFSDASHDIETLPDSRFKIPVGLRVNYFMGDRFIIRSFYRYYQDDWGLKAHTLSVETPVKITPFISVSPFYRYYKQTAIDYFAAYEKHASADKYYTSDYDLSAFDSHFGGVGFRFVSPDGIFGINKLNTLEIRYGHYSRATGLTSNIITIQAKIK